MINMLHWYEDQVLANAGAPWKVTAVADECSPVHAHVAGVSGAKLLCSVGYGTLVGGLRLEHYAKWHCWWNYSVQLYSYR